MGSGLIEIDNKRVEKPGEVLLMEKSGNDPGIRASYYPENVRR
jgi:hypothetical protein